MPLLYVFVQLVVRKPGLTLAEFKKRQEEEFVPLVKKVCGDLFPISWTRRYIAEAEHEAAKTPGALGLPRFLVGHQNECEWDSLGEMIFKDELHFQQFFAYLNEEEPAAILLEAEAKFSATDKLKFIVMEKYVDESEVWVRK